MCDRERERKKDRERERERKTERERERKKDSERGLPYVMCMSRDVHTLLIQHVDTTIHMLIQH